jgi:hypothetical protein
MLGYTSNIISLIYPQRSVYISSLIQPEQIDYIQNSIAKMNLTRTYDKFKYPNIIRIQYDDSIIANTKMSATLYSIGSFVVENTIISFNPNIYENVLGCVMLHELGHSVGLGHNNIMGSIMNFTLYINAYGYILNNNDECELSDDDINGINYFV